MEKDEIKTRVIEKLKEVSAFSEYEDIKESEPLRDLGLDSLDAVELMMNLESEFSIGISDDEAEKIENETVEDLINYVYDRVK